MAFVDNVRDRVLREIKDKDGVALRADTYAQLVRDFREQGELRSLGDDIMRHRLGWFVALFTTFTALVGFFGVKSISAGMEAELLKVAQQKINEESDRHRTSMIELSRSTERGAFRVAEETKSALEEKTKSAINEIDIKIRSVKAELDAMGREKEDALKQLNSSIEQSLTRSTEQAIKNIDRAIPSTLSPSGQPSSSYSPTHVARDPAKADLDDESVEVIVLTLQRRYDDLLELAKKLHERKQDQLSFRLLHIVYRNPVYFGDDKCNRANALLESLAFNHQELYEAATELTIIAVLTSNDPLYTIAQRFANESVIFSISPSDLAELARGVHERKNGVELASLFKAVKREELRTLGYLNLLALGKLARISEDDLRDVQREFVKQLLETNFIDAPTDYPLAFHAVHTLSGMEPVIDRDTLLPGLKRIKKYVLDGAGKALDPWGLKAMLEKALSEATAAAASSAPS